MSYYDYNFYFKWFSDSFPSDDLRKGLLMLFGLFIYLFLIIIRPQDFVSALEGLPLVYVSMSCILFAWFLSPVNKRLVKTAQDKYVLFLYITMILSTLTLHWIPQMIATFKDVMKMLLIYWFIVTIVDNEERFKKVIWMVVSLMAIVGLMGVMQAHGYDITGVGMLWDRDAWRIKLTGIFDNPNDIAYSVMLVTPFALGLILEGNALTRCAGIAMFAIGAYCVFLTGSRGGQVAVVVTMVVFFYYWFEKPIIRRIFFLIGVVIVSVSLSVQARDYRSDKSAMGRVEAWAVAWELMKEHPLLGVGKDQFREFHKRDTHSSYARALGEMGIPGIYAFIAIISLAMRNMIFLLRHTPHGKERYYFSSIVGYLGGFLMGSIFSTRLYDPVFMLMIALSSAACRYKMRSYGEGTFMVPLVNKVLVIRTFLVLVGLKLFMMQAW